MQISRPTKDIVICKFGENTSNVCINQHKRQLMGENKNVKWRLSFPVEVREEMHEYVKNNVHSNPLNHMRYKLVVNVTDGDDDDIN